MRTTKRVFLSFHPREIDSFAQYLHEQSLKGWHFKEWRFGLVFEKGEPKDIVYAVELSPKAFDTDMRPSEDTKDFAEYCGVAGWKFIDSHGKLCIFRREYESAIPIVTEEERFESVAKEEQDEWFRTYLGAILLGGMYILQFLTVRFEDWAFDNLAFGLILSMLLMAVFGVLEGIWLVRWKKKQQRKVDKGETIRYEGSRLSINRVRALFIVVLLTGVISLGMNQQMTQLAPLLFFFAGLGLIAFIISWWRPLNGDKQLFEIGGILLVTIAVIAFLFTGPYRTPEGEYEQLHQSILGSYRQGVTSIQEDGFHFESIDYRIYKSPYKNVMNKVWNEIYQGEFEEYSFMHDAERGERVKEAFGAEKVVFYGGEGYYMYYLKYPDCVAYAYVNSNQQTGEDGIEVMKKHLQLP